MGRYLFAVDLRETLRDLGHRLTAGGRRLVARLEEGQSMVEYCIIAALIAVVAMAAIQALGAGIAGVFQRILTSITGIG
jgi:Flp pilus assembly pilin Flp